MSPTRLLAIDVGTQSVRAIIFDRVGSVVARTQVKLTPSYTSPEPGWAELAPEAYWRALVEAVTRLWSDHHADPVSIAGLALTTQRGTIVCSDADGTPLRPAIVWPDQRLATEFPSLGKLWSVGFRMAGAYDLVRNLQRQAEVNWLAQHDVTYARTPRVSLLSGWLTHRLVGDWVDAVACQVGYVPFEYRTQEWAAAGSWRWQALAVRRDQLPRLVGGAQMLGHLTDAAANALGLPRGVRLIAAAADKACEVLGCGALEPDTAHCSFGTAATINTTQSRYLEVQRLLPAYPAAYPGAFNTEIQIERGFWLVSWFRQEFGESEVTRAAALGTTAESLFEELMAAVPPGALGLMLQPYWSPGLRDPGPEAKGAIIGFSGVHTRAHLYRALIEGIAYALRAGRERIERKLGHPLTRLVISGGGSQSDGAMQVTANVFNLVATRPAVHDASALGAAMLASVGVGLHGSVREAVTAMAHEGARFTPERDAVRTYDALYREVYRPLYARLAPLYHRIRAITGYPA